MKNLILIFCVLFLNACSSGDANENLISKDKMINILIDMHLAEAKVGQVKLPNDSSLQYYAYLQDEIFSTHGVDSVIYKKSMEYYSRNIIQLDEIYEAVLDSLNLMSATKAKSFAQ